MRRKSKRRGMRNGCFCCFCFLNNLPMNHGKAVMYVYVLKKLSYKVVLCG